MDEQQLISELNERNGVIEFYLENISGYTNQIGKITEHGTVVTKKMIKDFISRTIELKKTRDILECKLINSLIDVVNE